MKLKITLGQLGYIEGWAWSVKDTETGQQLSGHADKWEDARHEVTHAVYLSLSTFLEVKKGSL